MESVKKYILIIFLISLNLTIWSNENLFQEIKNKYETIKKYESEFIQKNFYQEMGEIIEYQGKIYYDDKKLILKYLNPKGQFLLIENGEYKLFDPLSEQLLIQDIDQKFSDIKPIDILKKYWNKSRIEIHNKEITLYPNDKEMDKIIISINDNYLIKSMSYFIEKDWVEYNFSNEKLNQPFNNKPFDYTLPKNTEVIRR